MIYAEILAGGQGKRMGNTEMPKQFLMLGTKPIMIHTIEQFVINKNIDKIIVCVPKDWISHTKDIIEKYLPGKEIDIVEGGSTRNETIMNGCQYIEKKYGLYEDDIIVTHDAVRPFVTTRIIDDNIFGMNEYDAVDTVVPATDTIVESKNGEFITDIPERKYMYQGQTPQTFKMIKLIEIYKSLTKEEKDILTDACKIFSIKGEKVKIIKGDPTNIKITNLYDLKLANSMIMLRGNK
ncbi:MAG: 2-C-methyl-D-erythritol 4-phosphate cytidylyltransferase [Erysipelotrichia bacterium]|jgi:2-C-methyl-D-erythritol 4-phosphate cytidylyltransferase|nr:2-C-methyl-D-erythritol 4-phosphate cytidylyltransferase [Erysipelotrichia bacterium]